MRIHDTKLDFSDVLMVPKRSILESRRDIDLTREFIFPHSGRRWKGVPIIVANTVFTGTLSMAKTLIGQGICVALHKHYDVDDLVDFYNSLSYQEADYVFFSIGIQPDDLTKLMRVLACLQTNNCPLYQLNIDVPNGYLERFPRFVNDIRRQFSCMTISAGNVCTAEMTKQLIISGADIVKIGIGAEPTCTTRLRAGVGMPQLSAIMECADAAHGLNGMIIGHGGLVYEGDFAKGFCAGADFLMAGKFFAGHDENIGDIIERDGDLFMQYSTLEGYELLIYKGSVINTVQQLMEGLRSCGTFIGARQLKHFAKCATFIRVY